MTVDITRPVPRDTTPSRLATIADRLEEVARNIISARYQLDDGRPLVAAQLADAEKKAWTAVVELRLMCEAMTQ